MRVPSRKIWRAFEEFDHLTDEECRKHVGDAWANATSLQSWIPIMVAAAATLLWPAALIGASLYPGTTRWVPVLPSMASTVIVLAASSGLVGGLTLLITRDIVLYYLLRRELRRADCPKCGQSLRGLRIQSVGSIPDPAKNFVRCTECGRTHNLLELGIAPRDLVPLEQRYVPENLAARRR